MARHGESRLSAGPGLRGEASDGSHFEAMLPFARAYGGAADAHLFAAEADLPDDWGLLLARRGGFAVARLTGERMVSSKVGQRHVQGRTKAGGQSQQRFARRRDNQARQAWEAAAGHAAQHLADLSGPLVLGGDRSGVEAVLEFARLQSHQLHWLVKAPGEPRRAALLAAVDEAGAIRVAVHNA